MILGGGGGGEVVRQGGRRVAECRGRGQEGGWVGKWAVTNSTHPTTDNPAWLKSPARLHCYCCVQGTLKKTTQRRTHTTHQKERTKNVPRSSPLPFDYSQVRSELMVSMKKVCLVLVWGAGRAVREKCGRKCRSKGPSGEQQQTCRRAEFCGCE